MLQNPVNQKMVQKMVHLNIIKPHYERNDAPEEDLSDLTDPPEVRPNLPPSVSAPGIGQPELPPIEGTTIQNLVENRVHTGEIPALPLEWSVSVDKAPPIDIMPPSPASVIIDPVQIDTDRYYEAECILQQRGTGNNRMFLVKWVGPEYDSTWEPDENIDENLLTSWFTDHTLESKLRKKLKKTSPKLSLLSVQTIVNKICALVKQHLPVPTGYKQNNTCLMDKEEKHDNISCVSYRLTKHTTV